jgi:hypothetical protein
MRVCVCVCVYMSTISHTLCTHTLAHGRTHARTHIHTYIHTHYVPLTTTALTANSDASSASIITGAPTSGLSSSSGPCSSAAGDPGPSCCRACVRKGMVRGGCVNGWVSSMCAFGIGPYRYSDAYAYAHTGIQAHGEAQARMRTHTSFHTHTHGHTHTRTCRDRAVSWVEAWRIGRCPTACPQAEGAQRWLQAQAGLLYGLWIDWLPD